MGLDDDDALLKQASHSSIPIQELLRIIEDVPFSNNQNGEQSQITSSVRTGGVRGDQAGITGRIDPKGKTKKFL